LWRKKALTVVGKWLSGSTGLVTKKSFGTLHRPANAFFARSCAGHTQASLTGTLDADLRQFVDTDDTVCSIDYPVNRYPEKVKSVGFDKQAQIEGCLAGIKGQYLIFDDNRVLNIRKHNGYRITVA
jgi:hypothetical protein